MERCWVGNDALPALRAGADRLQGIVLIAGTGSICYGADGAGRVVRTGGWGGLFGDEGSGFAIGRAALQAVAQSSDGRRAPTVLIDHVLEHLGLHEPDELIPWAYGLPPERQKSAVAALAPVVFAAVETGCDPARKIVEAAATDLRRHIEAVLVMLGSSLPRPTAVVLSGGVLRPESPLARLLEADIAREGLPVRPVRADISAARGALHLGEEIGS